ncbi:hypothetical protein [Halostella sp. PRR32]|uniref:hypothetical protein n=1 Tax=Halostella sp. PRR32 TaxID=3098147 RepID=UPI002B1E6B51|nr:hypothetical protein [Halostella sp. PRR32]
MARDIKSDLVAFLRQHFDSGAIPVTFEAGDPTDPTTVEGVRFADYDGANDYPQVAVVSEDPTTPGGGQTGYSGIDAGGGGGIQDAVTSVQIDCWGGPHDADIYQSEGSHPDVVANALGRETHRVLFKADESSSGPPVPDGYEWVNAEQPVESNDTKRSPTHYRRFVVAKTKHTETP